MERERRMDGRSLLPILALVLIPHALPSPLPLICNAGTDYSCHCRNATHPEDIQPDCSRFIESKDLPVIEMRVRNLNLNMKMHSDRTGESFERYFKRRIAEIVSKDCAHNITSCPGVELHLQWRHGGEVPYISDPDDPLLSQDNVIILGVGGAPYNVTVVRFVIVRSSTLRTANRLRPQDLVDSRKVESIYKKKEYISRVLGGVGIDNIYVVSMSSTSREDAGDNSKLHIMLAIAATFFGICYLIGGIKLYRDAQKRKRKRATESSEIVVKEDGKQPANYGAIQPSATLQNGKTHQQSLPTQIEETRKKSVVSEDESSFARVSRPRVLSERQARLMFGCDPSQLPKEPSIDHGLGETPPVGRHHTGAVPAVVLVTELSRESTPAREVPLEMHETAILSRDDSLPCHRPKSRRGSRVDDTGENIDLTERLPNVFEQAVTAPVTTQPSKEEAWSSSEGEMDVYYKLSEEDDGAKGDEWPREENEEELKPTQTEASRHGVIVMKTAAKRVVEDEEDSEDDKGPDDDVPGYERLREELSPLPPKANINLDANDYSDEDDLR